MKITNRVSNQESYYSTLIGSRSKWWSTSISPFQPRTDRLIRFFDSLECWHLYHLWQPNIVFCGRRFIRSRLPMISTSNRETRVTTGMVPVKVYRSHCTRSGSHESVLCVEIRRFLLWILCTLDVNSTSTLVGSLFSLTHHSPIIGSVVYLGVRYYTNTPSTSGGLRKLPEDRQ